MEQLDPERSVPAAALDALMHERQRALFCAMGDDGFRVPMPASAGLRDEQVLPLPADRVSMLDLVVPADRLAVINVWERARSAGLATTSVRPTYAPDRVLTLTIVDGRPLHGVWFGALADAGDDSAADGPALAGDLFAAGRPRTAIVHKNMFAVMTAVDDRTVRMFGWPASRMVGVRSLEFIHPEDHERALTNWMEMLGRQESQRVRLRHLCADGSWLWVEIENTYHGAENPDDVCIVAQVSDISDEMAAHEAVQGRERLFRRLAESLPTGVLQVDTDRMVVYSNVRFATILGLRHAGTLEQHLATIHEDDRVALLAAFDDALDRGSGSELEVRARHPDFAGLRRCTVTFTPLTECEGAAGALVCVNDVTESVLMREELQVQATTDALTGCHNRPAVMAAIDQALVDRRAKGTAVIFVDLDDFKLVNDTFGHATGDELLVHVAACLRGLIRAQDIVGRIGGDEFLVLCPRLDRPERALGIAERFADVLASDVMLSSGAVHVQASIGVAFSHGQSTCESLVAEADAAMYEAKRVGTGRPSQFDRLEHPLKAS